MHGIANLAQLREALAGTEEDDDRSPACLATALIDDPLHARARAHIDYARDLDAGLELARFPRRDDDHAGIRGGGERDERPPHQERQLGGGSIAGTEGGLVVEGDQQAALRLALPRDLLRELRRLCGLALPRSLCTRFARYDRHWPSSRALRRPGRAPSGEPRATGSRETACPCSRRLRASAPPPRPRSRRTR